MDEQKSLFLEIAEAMDRHLSRRKASTDASASEPGRLGHLLRWLMPNGGTLLLVALLILTTNVWAKPLLSPTSAPGPSATTVNYQGRLANSGGNPLSGTYGMTFALYSTATGGSPVWGPESHAAVPVSDGLFSVGLGSQTSGGIPTTVWDGDRYLEITVGGETLSPRELIRSVPIAGMALTVPDGSVSSPKIRLDSGTTCLSANTTLNMPGNWQSVTVPGLVLNFSLSKPSKVLVWIDGMAIGGGGGELNYTLTVDGMGRTGSWPFAPNGWFRLTGQRLINLDSGSHSLGFVMQSQLQTGITVYGDNPTWATCINYLVLGAQ